MQQHRSLSGTSTVYLTQLSILTAITAILTFFSLKIATLEITLATIPVVVGGIVLGVSGGAILGGVFGICSFIMCFGMSSFGVLLLEVSPIYCFLVCVPTRILMGTLSALLFRALKNRSIPEMAKTSITGFSGALMNTLFFMVTLIALFLYSEPLQSIVPGDSFSSIMTLFVTLAGVNAIVELITVTLLTAPVAIAVLRTVKHHG